MSKVVEDVSVRMFVNRCSYSSLNRNKRDNVSRPVGVSHTLMLSIRSDPDSFVYPGSCSRIPRYNQMGQPQLVLPSGGCV